MFFSCIVIMIIVSKFTRPVPLEKLGALTWKTINHPRYYDNSEHDSKETDFQMSESSFSKFTFTFLFPSVSCKGNFFKGAYYLFMSLTFHFAEILSVDF